MPQLTQQKKVRGNARLLKNRVPAGVTTEGEWACVKLDGAFSLKESDTVLSIMRQVSENGIEVFAVSAFSGDYIFMRNRDATASIDCLTSAGHHIT
jgi:hypothetical protein